MQDTGAKISVNFWKMAVTLFLLVIPFLPNTGHAQAMGMYEELREEAWYAMGNPPPFPGGSTPQAEAALTAYYNMLTGMYDAFVTDITKVQSTLEQVLADMADHKTINWGDVGGKIGVFGGTAEDIQARLNAINQVKADFDRMQQEVLSKTPGAGKPQIMTYLLNTQAGGLGLCNGYEQARSFSNNIMDSNRDSCWKDLSTAMRAALYITTPPPQAEQPPEDNTASNFNLDNLRKIIPKLMRLVFALSYTLGIIFYIMGLIKLKHAGENARNGSTQQNGVGSSLAYFIVGTMLIYLPSALQMSTSTILQHGDVAAYTYSTQTIGGLDFSNLFGAVVDIVRLVGVIAFVRGWILLVKLGSGQSQQGATTKGIVHIVGGILAVNILTTWEVIKATFGFVVG